MPPDSPSPPPAVPPSSAADSSLSSPRLWARPISPAALSTPSLHARRRTESPPCSARAPRDSDMRAGGPVEVLPPASPLATLPAPRRRRRPHLFRPRAPHLPQHYPSSAAFRHALVPAAAAAPPRRTLTLASGRLVELAPIPMGGNCGFVAVSWALLIAGRLPSNDTSGTAVRKALAEHVSAQAKFYAAKLVEWRLVAGGMEEAAASVAEFVRKVGEEGIRGHWLGQMWGFLEIFAIARAFRLNVELYTFDVASQKVRMYHQQNEGKVTVAMLFSGQADGGHFDLLLPTRKLSDRWKSKPK